MFFFDAKSGILEKWDLVFSKKRLNFALLLITKILKMIQNLSAITMVQNIKNVNKLGAIIMLHSQGFDFKLNINEQSDEVADAITMMLLGEDPIEVTNEVIKEAIEPTPQPVTNEAPQDEVTQVTPQQDPIDTPQDPTKQTKKVEDLTNALTIAYQRRSLKQAQTRTSARIALISIICNVTKMKPTDKRRAQIEHHIKEATTLEDLTAKVVTMMHPHK